jgi:hypothetical protein
MCLFYVFMTYSTSCCCHYKLKDPWNVCMYVCMYVCIIIIIIINEVFSSDLIEGPMSEV